MAASPFGSGKKKGGASSVVGRDARCLANTREWFVRTRDLGTAMRRLSTVTCVLWVAFCFGCGGTSGEAGPWYDTKPSDDLSYLPLGDEAYDVTTFTVNADEGAFDVDAYVPVNGPSPVTIMLPGAFVTKERYRWIGVSLASNGVATMVVQPRGDFSSTVNTLATVDYLAQASAREGDALFGRIDTSRLLLAGHSAGCVPQVGLTAPELCAAGFCREGDETPRALRGLMLLGFHNQTLPDDSEPMPAVESPWLIVNGTLDAFANTDKTDATVARIQDRPLYRVNVEGMNHYQLTDYVDVDADLRLDMDNVPTVSNTDARAAAAEYMVRFARLHLKDESNVDEDLGAATDARVDLEFLDARIKAPTGHGLGRVLSVPATPDGFDGGDDKIAVVADTDFGGARYFVVRTSTPGIQVWRMLPGGEVEMVPAPEGEPGRFYDNPALEGTLSSMAVFNDRLYVGVSSGVQGARLGSLGAEVWAYDGNAWSPIVSRFVDEDPALELSAAAGCEDEDGDFTATFTFDGASFTPGELAGAFLDDLEGVREADGVNRFRVIDNGAKTITVQRDDVAGTDEFTTCDGITVGHTFFVRQGTDEAGFGELWNKAAPSMAAFGGKLYIGSGLNYTDGAALYVSEDGVNFEVLVPRSYFGTHDSGVPITTSLSSMHVTAVGSEPTLLFGGTGTEGYGARLFSLDAAQNVAPLVDRAFDADDVGFDEPGMGQGNHQVASMVDWNGRLFIATMHFEGMEVFSATDPLDPATWRVEVGNGSAAFGPGWGDDNQLNARLSVINGQLWAASTAFIQAKGELTSKSAIALRTANGTDWQLATAHAFGVNSIMVGTIFGLGDEVYAVSSRAALATRQNFGRMRVYRLDFEE